MALAARPRKVYDQGIYQIWYEGPSNIRNDAGHNQSVTITYGDPLK